MRLMRGNYVEIISRLALQLDASGVSQRQELNLRQEGPDRAGSYTELASTMESA